MDIASLQRRLKVNPDGRFGPQTATALFAFFEAKPAIAAKLGKGAAGCFERYGLLDGSGLRLAHFIAQVGHESGSFKWMEEIASGHAYEGRADLGNVHVGDGKRFKGRGPLQLTGRANYRAFGEALDLQLEANPEIAANPEVGILIACEFWRRKGLNAYADRDDIIAITKRINGGRNGLVDRQYRLALAKSLIL